MRLLLLSLTCLMGCRGLIPNAPVCFVDTVNMQTECYNVLNDYYNDGTRKEHVRSSVEDIEDITDFDGLIFTTPDGYKNIQKSMSNAKAHIEGLQEDLDICKKTRARL